MHPAQDPAEVGIDACGKRLFRLFLQTLTEKLDGPVTAAVVPEQLKYPLSRDGIFSVPQQSSF